jgi:beta-lactamase superfamily II metal-dependent hydrolase
MNAQRRKAAKKVSTKKARRPAAAKAATKKKRATAAKSTKKKKTSQAAATGSSADGVRIRMYDIGFGDCFLVFVPTTEGVKKVLVDCGSIKKHKKSTDQIVDQVLEDVTEDDGVARIDVVIATHRHKDHVDGFGSSAWQQVEVKEVWMPWTEHPTDSEALRIRRKQHGFALQLHDHLVRLGASPDLIEFAVNALSNAEAMDTLHSGFAGQPVRRFLPDDSAADSRTLTSPALPGVRIHVLGPSRDEDVIRDMDPPSESSFLRLASLGERGQPQKSAPRPFSVDWVTETPTIAIGDSDKEYIQAFGSDLQELLAASLDSAVNGTSLMLCFQVGKAYLLFPGDAQWGTWNMVLNDQEWRALLEKTRFYKVGHHGSHNATPVEFVNDTVGGDFWAMIPVTPHGLWKDIPRKPLVDAMKKKTKKLVRSDNDSPDPPFTRQGDWWTETVVPIV